MKRHVDPFPAVADLFAGLLIATFGGLMLFAKFTGDGNVVDQEARRLTQAAQSTLERTLGGRTRECGGDVCVDVSIQFAIDESAVPPPFASSLAAACAGLKQALSHDPSELEIAIEGHTDSTQAQNVPPGRARFLYNWDLSARRASSVLYEFKSCGIEPGPYRIVALGYADTQPIGTNRQNRRTTFRLRPDRDRIARRLALPQAGRR